jgi:hypothetical protein
MKYKSLLIGAAMFLSVVAVGSAKSWDIVVDSTAKAGTVQLPAGDYSVKLNGTTAVFRSSDSGKTYTSPVKVEKVAKKYAYTAVENTTKDKTEVIDAIELGGTDTRVQFSD